MTLLVTVVRGRLVLRLGTSPGVPDPHAFAVRDIADRWALEKRPAVSRPPHPAPRVVTIRAKRPSRWDGMAAINHYFTKNGSDILSACEPDDPTCSGVTTNSVFREKALCLKTALARLRSAKIAQTDLPVGQSRKQKITPARDVGCLLQALVASLQLPSVGSARGVGER